MKSVELLSHADYELNMRRRECLKNDIDKEKYLGLFSQNVPVNENLFGGDINKRLDDIEKANKVDDKAMTKRRRPCGFSSYRGRRFNLYNTSHGQGEGKLHLF
ncbi:hypothetical protein FSP39_019267 [Pinctada imbricata]|uniref:Uncharacterized protein n=1 Tax=Pinctada imbricata TaxID=66713 RepID=A0AA88XS50_PINIB|nr:hypothetical protein FSP39_019267 [Pinctada imbricata]